MITAEEIEHFIDYRNSLNKELREGVMMYDIPKYHRWLSEKDLIEYWINHVRTSHPTTLPSDWTKQCSCNPDDKIGETWCCNTCGKPTPRLSTELPSDADIKASAINNLMHIESPASNGLEFSTAEENIAIEADTAGAKWMRSIASAKLAEMERELQEAKQLLSAALSRNINNLNK